MHNFPVKLLLVAFVVISFDSKAFDWFPGRTTNRDEQTFDGYGNGIKPFSSTPHYSTFGYAGQLLYPGTGLTHMRNRFYSPVLGRFLALAPPKNGKNWYAYPTDPINNWDPTGLEEKSILEYRKASWESDLEWFKHGPVKATAEGIMAVRKEVELSAANRKR